MSTNISEATQFVGDPLNEGLRLTVLTLGSLACVNGVFGNVLIITTLLSQPALRSVHNIYIANLALADLILSGYLLPMWLLDLYLGHHPVLNAAHCLFNSYGLCGAFSASVLTLLAISINRYVSVCHYQVFLRVFSKQRTLLLCVVTWIVGHLLCLPSLMEAGSSGYDSSGRICSFTRAEEGPLKMYSRIYTAAMLLLPAIIVGFANSAIYRHWRRSKRRLQKWCRPSGKGQGDKVKVSISEVSRTACGTGEGRQAGESKESDISSAQPGTVGETCVERTSSSSTDKNMTENNEATSNGSSHTKTHAATLTPVDSKQPEQEATNELIQHKHRNKQQRQQFSLTASDLSLIRSLLTVFVCCVILYLPLSIITIVDLFVPQSSNIINAAVFCAFLNHSINWIVYGLMNRSFREGYWQQLGCCCQAGGLAKR